MDGSRQWHASSEQEATEVDGLFPAHKTAVAQKLPSPQPSEIASRPDDSWNITVIGRIHQGEKPDFGLTVLGAKASRPVTVNFIGPVEDADYQTELEHLAAKNFAVEVVFHHGRPPSELVAIFKPRTTWSPRRPKKIWPLDCRSLGPWVSGAHQRTNHGAALRHTTSGGICRSMNRNGTP